MKDKLLAILLFSALVILLLCSWIDKAFAFGIVHDPWNTMQNAATAVHTAKSYYADMEQVRNQYQQIKDAETQMKSTGFHHLSDFTKSANDVGNIASEGKAMTYSTKDLNTKFDKEFGSQKKGDKNWVDRENSMMDTVLDTSKGTLNSANKQMAYTKGESGGLDQMVNHSDSADGTKAVLQGTNQLLDANAAQLQAVHQSLSQMQSQNATVAAANAAREKHANEADQAFLHYQANYTGYEVQNNLKQIPTFGQ